MEESDGKIIRVGSRKSELALIQTRHVISLLKQLYPKRNFEIVTMSTLGDRILNISLPKIGEKSLFTKDLEEALENGSVDFVVHSLKDLPTTLPNGMAIGAVLEREDPRDALILREDHKGHTLTTLPEGSIIGTSSLRRTAQLSRNFPHLKVVDIRGNLNTRLKKLDHNCKLNGENEDADANGNPQNNKDESAYPNYAAIMLAQAGLVRMGWQSRISQVLSDDEILYAVGQGALAVECKSDNREILEMLSPLNHEITYCRILAERSFLKTLGGGCSAPVAITTDFNEADVTNSKSQLNVTGAVWSLNGKIELRKSLYEIFEKDDWKSKAAKHKLSDVEISNIPRKIRTCGSQIDSTNRVCCRREYAINSAVQKAESVEIENLINAHGTLFKCCPFTDQNGTACPVKFGVGEEFMGSCPYLSTDGADDINEILVKLHPKRQSYDIKKCPFMSNQMVAQKEDNGNDSLLIYNVGNESKAKNCPFLKSKTVQQEATSDNGNVVVQTCDVSERLYCGLSKHTNIPEHVLEKCEDLGKRLARSLIDDGALEVMKCSQDFIRSTAPVVITASTT